MIVSAAANRTLSPEPIDPQLCALYRRATPTEKLAVVNRINTSLQALKAAQLRSQYPELSDDDQQRLLRRWWLAARD